MNRVSINSFDFYDDFYTLKWTIAANAGSITIVNQGFPKPTTKSVKLVDNSTSGKTGIRTAILPETRDTYSDRAPPDFEVIVIGDYTTPTNIAWHCKYLYPTSGYYNFNLGFPKYFYTRIVRVFFGIKSNPTVYSYLYKKFKNELVSFFRSTISPAFHFLDSATEPVAVGTGWAATGEVYVDLVAVRQIHLTESPQHRPNSKVYAHVHNGRGKEVGVMSVGGVM